MRGHFAVGYRHVGKRERGEESSAWLARLGAPRTAESPCDPCVNPSLTSTCAAPAALNGRPLHSVHALPSTLFSLLPTMARTTFYPLLPSPYSYWIIVRYFTLCGRCRGFLPWRFPFFEGVAACLPPSVRPGFFELVHPLFFLKELRKWKPTRAASTPN